MEQAQTAGGTSSRLTAVLEPPRRAQPEWGEVQLPPPDTGSSIRKNNKGHWLAHGLMTATLASAAGGIGYLAAKDGTSELRDCKTDNRTNWEKAKEVAEELQEAQESISYLKDEIDSLNSSASCTNSCNIASAASTLSTVQMQSDQATSTGNTIQISITPTPTAHDAD
ncbi:uncharacterized protein I206_100003 [Kwoniella pini CBS 10737]|uniref:Uncharacterized protein n=1 Tax=Kwoniella pini CBS 10737 TaxID=1296096 RepID=A0A1B9HSC4_9TREE|nr:uncharacterized protein I206_07818 [Kwoniella pini CBS 10737]OCF46148.1 hypothetical protein I206_07818 [Kwoniella pini CBS 10737]